MTIKGAFESVGIREWLPNEIIFDFNNNWHCALKLRKGMTREEVAYLLQDLSDLILRTNPRTQPDN